MRNTKRTVAYWREMHRMCDVWIALIPHSWHVDLSKVTKMLGNGRLEAMCFDGVKRLCHIRGKLRKKVNFGKQTSFNPPKSNPTNTTFMFSPKTFGGNKLVITFMAGVDKPVRHCPYWPSWLSGEPELSSKRLLCNNFLWVLEKAQRSSSSSKTRSTPITFFV